MTMDNNGVTNRRHTGRRILKSVIVTLCSVAALVLLTLGLISWILTPEKLTGIVEKYANEYLKADVSVKRVELTVWSSFPRLELTVDSLDVVSYGLKGIADSTRAQLPADADTLLRIPHFRGGLNLTALAAMKIELYNVLLKQPSVNVVFADSLTSNLDIFYPSADNDDSNSISVIPQIAIDRFIIEGDAPIRYFSLADSIDASLCINSTQISDKGLPVYGISADANARASMASVFPATEMRIGLDGKLNWDPQHPLHAELSDFTIAIGPLTASIDLSADMTDDYPVIEAMTLDIEPLSLDSVIAALPAEWTGNLDKIKSTIAIEASSNLLKPYRLGTDKLPCMHISADIPEGRLDFERLHLTKASLGIDIDLDGDSLNASAVTLRKLRAQGRAIDMSLDGSISEPMTDPRITGHFTGQVDMSLLPSGLRKLIPAEVSGVINGETNFRFRVSQLNARKFHEAKMNGRIALSRFRITEADSLDAYLHSADLKFGTNSSFVRDSIRTDSLLTMSVKVDSTVVVTPEMRAMLKGLKFGIGCRNTTSAFDTTQITPIGATIHVQSIMYRSLTDSVRMMMRDMICGASLTRFKGERKVPRLGLRFSVSRAFMGDNSMRLALRDGHFDISAHLNKRPAMPRRLQERYDSIARANPGITDDSIRVIIRSQYAAATRSTDNQERLDLSLDKSTAALLRRWDVQGQIKAASGRVMTPLFPLRNRFNDLECRFNTDSVVISNAACTAGESDLAISGTISNIRSALTSSHSRRPLKIEFDLNSDTININQLTQAIYRGALMAQQRDSVTLIDTDNEELLQKSIDETGSDMTGAVLIPTNITAELNVNARNIIYADVPLHDFKGSLLMERGALNLHDITAHTDIGSASLNALYYAPMASDIIFGLGLKLKDFHIGKVIQLMPQIDSIMPILNDISGIIDVDLATTTRIDSLMNFDLPSLKAALKMRGDSLVVLDPDTYKTMAKWLMFKNKHHNMINHMEVEMVVENSTLELYPFMFDFDRYKLGVMGSNDLSMNLNYHVSVLKSPLPFKFGINITGNADDMKIRVGRARFKENMVGERIAIADTTRVNLVAEIDRVFRRGVNAARLAPLQLNRPVTSIENAGPDTIAASDSITLIKEGLIEGVVPSEADAPATDKKDKKKRNK